jgi:hypothetical protein
MGSRNLGTTLEMTDCSERSSLNLENTTKEQGVIIAKPRRFHLILLHHAIVRRNDHLYLLSSCLVRIDQRRLNLVN